MKDSWDFYGKSLDEAIQKSRTALSAAEKLPDNKISGDLLNLTRQAVQALKLARNILAPFQAQRKKDS